MCLDEENSENILRSIRIQEHKNQENICCGWFDNLLRFNDCCCSWLIGEKNSYFSPRLAKGFTHGKNSIWTCHGCEYGKKCRH